MRVVCLLQGMGSVASSEVCNPGKPDSKVWLLLWGATVSCGLLASTCKPQTVNLLINGRVIRCCVLNCGQLVWPAVSLD